jgi:hypothetical protein
MGILLLICRRFTWGTDLPGQIRSEWEPPTPEAGAVVRYNALMAVVMLVLGSIWWVYAR